MYIYGKNVAKEKLKTGEKISKAYISKNFKEQDLIDQLRERKIPLKFVAPNILDKKTDGLHQGIILEIDEIPTYTLEDYLSTNKKEGYQRIVLLDHLEDPHNFGAIIRTSVALGVEAIIIPNDRTVSITPTVIKTSAGAIEHIKIIKIPNLQVAIKKLKENNFWIIGTDMQGTNYRKINYDMNTCLVIGNEGKGISPAIKKQCDFITTIPMSGKINSLNASVSCAIILSQMVSGDK